MTNVLFHLRSKTKLMTVAQLQDMALLPGAQSMPRVQATVPHIKIKIAIGVIVVTEISARRNDIHCIKDYVDLC